MTLSHITIDGGTDDTPIGNNGDAMKVDGSGVTQPVSAASLPLPSGAATAANQTTGNTSLSSIDTKTPALVSGRQPVDGSGVTQPISAASLPLPSGAATSALQTTGNTSLSSIDTKTPALGQALAAASTPVVLTAAQITTLTPPTVVTAKIEDTAGNTLNSNSGSLFVVGADSAGIFNSGRVLTVQGAGIGSGSMPVTGSLFALLMDGSGNILPSSTSSPVGTERGLITRNIPSGTQAVSGTFWQTTQPVSAASLPLPTGAATSALQTTANTSLSSIDAGIPAALGSTTSANSMPVVIASDQASIPVTATISGNASEAELATFVVYAQDIAIGNNKSMVSIVNTTGSTVKVKIREIRIINTQVTAVTGVVADFRLLKCVSHSVGTTITPSAHDSSDSINASVTARTGATIGTEGTAVYRRWQWSTDEWGVGANDVESADHASQATSPHYYTMLKSKPIVLNANEGITLKQVTNSTVGTFDIVILFTQE